MSAVTPSTRHSKWEPKRALKFRHKTRTRWWTNFPSKISYASCYLQIPTVMNYHVPYHTSSTADACICVRTYLKKNRSYFRWEAVPSKPLPSSCDPKNDYYYCTLIILFRVSPDGIFHDPDVPFCSETIQVLRISLRVCEMSFLLIIVLASTMFTCLHVYMGWYTRLPIRFPVSCWYAREELETKMHYSW